MFTARKNTNNIKLQKVKRKSAPLSSASLAPQPVLHPERPLSELPTANKWIFDLCKLLSHVQLFATPWTIQSMEFSRPECWSGQTFPSPGDLPNPGFEPRSPTLQVDSLPADLPGKPNSWSRPIQIYICIYRHDFFKNNIMYCSPTVFINLPIYPSQLSICLRINLFNLLSNIILR